MAITTTTRTIVFARAANNRTDNVISAQSVASMTGLPYVPPAVTGLVEIVEETTTTRVRSDKTRLPGRPVVVERVLATVTVEAALHLSSTLSSAAVEALDTRAAAQPVAVESESE